MKEEIDAMIAQYGQENARPPWTTFTIANDIKEGNMYVIRRLILNMKYVVLTGLKPRPYNDEAFKTNIHKGSRRYNNDNDQYWRIVSSPLLIFKFRLSVDKMSEFCLYYFMKLRRTSSLLVIQDKNMLLSQIMTFAWYIRLVIK